MGTGDERSGADRISRRRAAGLMAGAALAGVLDAVAPGRRAGRADAAAARTFRMAYASDIYTLDPDNHTDTTTHVVLSLIFDALVQMGRSGKWEPALAERWDVVNNTTVRFHLRKGVKFHNGDALTAGDIRFTFDHIRDPAVKSPAQPLFAPFESVTVDDAATVTVKTKDPDAAMFSLLSRMWILPSAYFGRVGQEGFAKAPAGTGPYRFKDWVKDVRVEMDSFSGSWRGSPSIQGFSYRPIPEDAARLAALQSNEVDLIRPLAVDQVAAVKSRQDLWVGTRPGQQIYCGLNTLTFAPFKDRRVRQAVNYGVNLDSIVKNLFLGLAVRLNGPFFTVTPGYDRSLAPYPYDPERARRMLAEAGYGNGFDATLTVPAGVQGAQKFPEVAQAIAADLGRIGVRVKLVQVEPAAGFDLYRARKFEMYLFPWQSNPESGLHIESLFASYTRGYYYKSAEADALIKPYMATLDPKEREVAGGKLLRFLHDDAPWIFMYMEPDLYGVRKGVRWTPNPYDYLIRVSELTIT
jgi:peptide/nickel transport system substrate-binding protein